MSATRIAPCGTGTLISVGVGGTPVGAGASIVTVKGGVAVIDAVVRVAVAEVAVRDGVAVGDACAVFPASAGSDNGTAKTTRTTHNRMDARTRFMIHPLSFCSG